MFVFSGVHDLQEEASGRRTESPSFTYNAKGFSKTVEQTP